MKNSSPAARADSPAPEARYAVLTAAIASGALVGQHVAGKATRDTLFLDHFGLGLLPAAMIGAAVLSALAVIVVSRVLARYGPARVVPVMFSLGALLFGFEWSLSRIDERAATLVVYMHTALFSAAGMSAFWSLVNERFDPSTAKRVVGEIASGGTLGGIAGGVLVWRAAEHLSVPTMLAGLAGLNVLGFAAAVRFARGARGEIAAGPERREDDTPSGLSVLRETPYLRDLAVLVLSGAVVQALLDWLLSAHASMHYGQGAPLLAFFALFNMVVGVLSFLAQTSLSRPLLERLGLAATVKVEPVSVVLGCAFALVAPRMSTVVVLRAVEAITRNSLYRSAYELFYTPLPTDKKRPTKTLIDVGLDRLGTALGSLALLAITRMPLPIATRVVLFGTIVAAAVGWLIAARLKDGYVAALASSLKSGVVALGGDEALDVTTRRTLAETTALLDREKLLARIEELHRAKERTDAAGEGAVIGAGDEVHLPPLPSRPRGALDSVDQHVAKRLEDDPLLVRAAELRSGDPECIRRALSPPFPTNLAVFVVPLLANDVVARDAVRTLRRLSPRITGLLLDTLLDLELDPRVRRRVPRVLKASRSPRAARGLLLGLADPVFDVRVQVGLALGQWRDDGPIPINHHEVFEAVIHELTIGRSSWPTGPAAARSPDVRSHAAASHERRAGDDGRSHMDENSRGLAHVFTLLGLVLDREPLGIAHRALRSSGEDASLRGTALEYLDAVLPASVRDVLVPVVVGEAREKRPSRARAHHELAEELLRSSASLPRPIRE